MNRARSDRRWGLCVGGGVWLACALALARYAGADVSSLDAGELGGAAWSLGVAHPTGFPLDMLLLRCWGLMPLGSLAFRQNLGVSLIAATAVSCVAWACLRLCRQCGWESGPALAAGAGTSAAALLSSRTFLDAALSVEVYATALLCVAAVGLLLDAANAAARRAAWPLIGLALGAHITAPLLLSPLVLAAWARCGRVSLRSLGPQLVCCGFGALVLCYVPLAALRDTAFDWGDPEVLSRWFRHVSAARIREAYADALFSTADRSGLQLFEQLTEHAYWIVVAGLGVVGSWRRQRARTLVLGVVLSFDVAYAAWINPMGIAQRQVGHVSSAVLAIFAGCGCSFIVARLQVHNRRLGAWVSAGVIVAGGVVALRGLAQTALDDGYAVAERYGAASPLVDLPPRAVYVCQNDSACASALFAVYAEGSRPDLDVVPAQHLWDPTVLRRLRGLPLSRAIDAATWPGVERRAAWALRRRSALLTQSDVRPVYAEDAALAERAGLDLSHAPFFGVRVGPPRSLPRVSLAGMKRARFGVAGPQTPLARTLWAGAHGALGSAYLRAGQSGAAVDEFAQAVALTPRTAAAVSNLGVALEQRGDLAQALERTAHAVQLDPSRATPWVNLARLLLRLHGPQAARAALVDARRYEVRDPRLDALARELGTASEPGTAALQ